MAKEVREMEDQYWIFFKVSLLPYWQYDLLFQPFSKAMILSKQSQIIGAKKIAQKRSTIFYSSPHRIVNLGFHRSLLHPWDFLPSKIRSFWWEASAGNWREKTTDWFSRQAVHLLNITLFGFSAEKYCTTEGFWWVTFFENTIRDGGITGPWAAYTVDTALLILLTALTWFTLLTWLTPLTWLTLLTWFTLPTLLPLLIMFLLFQLFYCFKQ